MKRFLVLILLLIITNISYAKEFAVAAVKINVKNNELVGMLEINGEKQLFSFQLKQADYNDGHTIVIYKKWMPEIPEGYGLRMHLYVPEEFLLVTESNRSENTYTGVRYEFDNPQDGITLALSDKWVKETTSYQGIDISTYFTVANRVYTQSYFSRIKELLKVYTEKLGGYPYSEFKVVEVPYPAGHALTGMTFISGSIVGMPFLTEVSLGHELVHQWVGVGVQAERESGNWAEALTTYLADRLYADMKGEAADYRKNSLASYMAHARQKEDGTCLMDFRYNADKSAQAVGYAKGMMVFSMLESIVGKEDFNTAVKVFIQRNMHKKASWDDIITIMEDVSGILLKDFINGWLTETALAEFYISDWSVKPDLKGYQLDFTIKNVHKNLEYPLEIIINTEGRDVRDYLYIKGGEKTFTIKTDDRPLKITADPEYKTARLLTDAESAPVLHHLYSKYKKTVFVNPEQRAVYSPFIMALENASVVSDDTPPYQYSDSILVFLGADNRAFEKFYRQKPEKFDGKFLVKSYKHPSYSDRMSYLIISKDMETTASNTGRMKHYGKYSELTLTDGREYDKATDDTAAGYQIEFKSENRVVKVENGHSIDSIVNSNPDARVFYVGETHSEYAHHENQLAVIRKLHQSGRDIAIGMEMFQRRFQPFLDEYMAGGITQQEMLKKTEYFDRWRFDFRLYKMIMDFAYRTKTPIIALNMEQEITKKVSSGGISSLADDDLASLPSDIEYTAGRYKDSLKSIFQMHESRMKFENFYEAQLLWDETMAESAHNYLKNHPHKTLVVLAGNGHLGHRKAIPDRLERRGGYKSVLIVQDMEQEDGVADYILYPDTVEYIESPKIGVMIDETEKGVLVKEVTKDSVAEKTGIIAGDYITELDGVKVSKLADLKIALLYAESGKSYSVKVKRADEPVIKLKMEF
jgi:uncharacterized iron-regulated protein